MLHSCSLWWVPQSQRWTASYMETSRFNGWSAPRSRCGGYLIHWSDFQGSLFLPHSLKKSLDFVILKTKEISGTYKIGVLSHFGIVMACKLPFRKMSEPQFQRPKHVIICFLILTECSMHLVDKSSPRVGQDNISSDQQRKTRNNEEGDIYQRYCLFSLFSPNLFVLGWNDHIFCRMPFLWTAAGDQWLMRLLSWSI